jgi:hypothetical protein
VSEVINDATALNEIRLDWAGVRDKQERIGSNAGFVIASGGLPLPDAHLDLCYSLALVWAFAVIEQSLRTLKDENVFKTEKGRKNLKALMEGSQGALPWQDFTKVDKGRDERNNIAHEGKLLGSADCCGYIDAIERELKAWHIL